MKRLDQQLVLVLCLSVATASGCGSAIAEGPRPDALLVVDQHREAIVERTIVAWPTHVSEEHALALRKILWGLRADRLLAASLSPGLDGLLAVLDGTDQVPGNKTALPKPVKALGDPVADLTYTPLTPCRIADTRVAGGALTPNTTRTLIGYTASTFGPQGGEAGTCGIPNGVAALAMNVYAVNPTTLGFIKLWASNQTEPAVSTVNYQPPTVAIATGAIVPVNSASNNEFNAKSPAPVDLIVDVTGYFRSVSAQGPGLRIVRDPVIDTVNSINGSSANNVTSGVRGATVSGGGSPTDGDPEFVGASPNRVTDAYGAIGGGAGNRAGNDAGTNGDAGFATVSGGYANTASGEASVVGGGTVSVASGTSSTVAGGYRNYSSGARSAVTGGYYNTASGDASYIGGGEANTASGAASTIGGGRNNTTSEAWAAIGGGINNFAAGMSSVCGGDANYAVGGHAFIGGGYSNAAHEYWTTLGGGMHNIVRGNFSTIAGGFTNRAGYDTYPNGTAATVGGGMQNRATANHATIAGGYVNWASADQATVGGGYGNGAHGYSATVGGGYSNAATGQAGTIAGGNFNTASGNFAAVGGGEFNKASGTHAWAAGRRAVTETSEATPVVHDGTFVWADSNDVDFRSTATNQFSARATGGVRFVTAIDGTGLPTWTCGVSGGAGGSWGCTSDRAAKIDLIPLDGAAVLERVAALPVYQWVAKDDPRRTPHAGPTAQDFMATFGLGDNDRMIGFADAQGVAFAAIQGLNAKLAEAERSITELRQLVETLLARIPRERHVTE